MAWDDLANKMDAAVDSVLGDDVFYAKDGTSFTCIKAFILTEHELTGLEELDTNLGSRQRLKVAKSKVATISQTHRIRAARLGDGVVYRPANRNPVEDGRFWYVDLQKV